MKLFNGRGELSAPRRWLSLGALWLLALQLGCDDEPSAGLEAGSAGAGLSAGVMGGTAGTGGTGGAGGAGVTAGEGGEGGEGGVTPPVGGLQLEGVSGPVGVRFDELGVAHISCETRADCFEAQGYLHAAHRFVQMDINRMFPQGRLSERIGQLGLGTDRGSRLIFATRSGERIEQQMWEASHPETKAMLEAYARGVNAWLADLRAGRNGAQLSEEYAFPLFTTELIEDWRPQDSLSVALILIRQLTEDSGPQLRRAERLEQLGAELFSDSFGPTPAFPTGVLLGSEGVEAVAGAQEKSLEELVRSQLEGLRSARLSLMGASRALVRAQAALPHKSLGEDFGSNNWIVSPARSASGKALMSNDPHLGLSNPSVWYLAHLRVEGDGEGAEPFDVQGFSLPGLPSVVIGHNEKISWGMTTTYFDFSDVYIETLSSSGEGVIFNGEEVPFLRVVDELIVSDDPEGARYERLYVPHHGPVLSIDREAGVAVTLRWTAQDADSDVNFLMGLPLAQSVEEAREALKELTTIGQNVVVADVEGHIGWFPYNRLPSRAWASPALNPSLPLPGDGSAEWGEPIPYEALPQAFDPALGVLATANHDMTGAFADGDPTNDGQAALQEDPAKGYRYSQIMRLLDREEPHSPESLLNIIHDNESLLARRLLPELLRLLDREALNERGAQLIGLLEPWGYGCPAGVSLDEAASPVASEEELSSSRGCLAFHALLGQLVKMTFRDELRAAGLSSGDAHVEALARLLGRPEVLSSVAYWDDVSTEELESAGQMIASAANRASFKLNEELGADSALWLWGRLHTLSLGANLINDAGITDFNHGPFPNHGGLYTVDVANPRDIINGDYTHGAGASMRFVCELDGYPRCSYELPGGQRHFRDDPHYDDLLRRWLGREPTAMHFEELEIEAATLERWRFVPSP